MKNTLENLLMVSSALTNDCPYDYLTGQNKRSKSKKEIKTVVYKEPTERDPLRKKLHKQKIKERRKKRGKGRRNR